MNALKGIWDGNQIHPDVDTRDARFQIRDCIKQTQNQWKGAYLSENSMGQVLHEIFKVIVEEVNISSPTLVESCSEVSHFILEPRNFAEVIILPADVKQAWLEETLK